MKSAFPALLQHCSIDAAISAVFSITHLLLSSFQMVCYSRPLNSVLGYMYLCDHFFLWLKVIVKCLRSYNFTNYFLNVIGLSEY